MHVKKNADFYAPYAEILFGCLESFFFFNKFIYFIYLLFLAVLGLHCCTGATLKCGVWASHCGGFSCCEAWALGARAQ